jgi:hypothetical protein
MDRLLFALRTVCIRRESPLPIRAAVTIRASDPKQCLQVRHRKELGAIVRLEE